MANGGWTGAAGGFMAGMSLGGPLVGLGGAIVGYFTDAFGGGAEPQMESDETRRMRETLTNQYLAQLQHPGGFTPQQMATLQEAVAQNYMLANREVGQRVNQYMAGRGLLDSSSAAMAQGEAQRGLSAAKAQGMANITLQDILLQQQNRQAATSGLQSLLGQMSEADLARYYQALQRQQTIGTLWGQAIGTYQSAQVPDYLGQFGQTGYIPGTGSLAPTTLFPTGSDLTGGYMAPVPQYPTGLQGMGIGQVSAMGVPAPQPRTYAQSQGLRRFPQRTIATISPIYNASRRSSNMAPTQRV